MNQEILFVNKTNDGMETYQVMDVFETSEDLGAIKTAVEQARDRLYVTWATVDVRDKEKQKVPIEEAIAQQQVLMRRGAPITDHHTNSIVGRTLAWKVMLHPVSQTLGVLHLEQIYADNERDDIVWEEIVSGKRTGSSVGGFNMHNRPERDPGTGEVTTMLQRFRQVETASVVDPCNPLALNEAFSVVAKGRAETTTDKYGQTLRECNEETKKESSPTEGKEMEAVKKEDFDALKSDVQKTNKALSTVAKAVEKLVTKMEEEDTKPPEEEKKEEEKPSDKKKVKKEDASSDIDGESSAPAPESPVSEDNNEQPVFKASDVASEVNKAVAPLAQALEEIKKGMRVSSPRAGSAGASAGADLVKDNKPKRSFDSNLPLQMALGRKKVTGNEVHKMGNELFKSQVGNGTGGL